MPKVDCDKLWAKIQAIQAEIDRLTSGPYAQLIAQFEALMEHYNWVKAEQDEIGAILQAGYDLATMLGNHGFSSVDEARARRDELEEQLTPLWEQADEIRDQLEDLDEDLSVLREIEDLCGQSELFDGGVGTIESIIEDGNFGSGYGESPQVLEEVESCDDVPGLIEAKETEYARLNDDLNEVSTQINQLEPTYNDLSTKIEEWEEWEAAVSDRYSGLLNIEDAIAFLQQELDSRISELAAVRQQMSDLLNNEVVQEYDSLMARLAELQEEYRTHCDLESDNTWQPEEIEMPELDEAEEPEGVTP